jgi:hypothetical protein
VLAASPVFAQDVTEPALKAAYIYNFARFTEWPRDAVANDAPLVMCVLGDGAVGTALEQTVKGRTLGGHFLSVLRLTIIGPKQICHVLYVTGVTVDRAAQLIAGVRELPVLTISDIEGFTERGGIARFFFEHGRLRFSVQVEAAKRAGLQISSKLLVLAKIERPIGDDFESAEDPR